MKSILNMFLLLCLFPVLGMSQSYKSLRKEGDRFFKEGFYDLAVNRYEDCFRQKPTNYFVNLNLGIAYLRLNQLDDAENMLQGIYLNKKRKYPQVVYYLGRLYHRKNNFRKAAKYYKEFLRKHAKSSYADRIKTLLINCENGMLAVAGPKLAAVERLDKPVNSPENDFHPIFSPNLDRSKIYFSSNRAGAIGNYRNNEGLVDNVAGHRNPDMYVASLSGTITLKKLSGLLNTALHDEVLGFNSAGNLMYYKKGYTADSGLLYEDNYKNSSKERFTKKVAEMPFSLQEGDRTPFWLMDSIVVFSSKRLEGYGGYDLFWVSKSPDGWGKAVNLGPNINTQFDEMSPFLTNNRQGLYFSSNNRESSIGGFDIYKSNFSMPLNQWLPSKNLGVPINSADDDLHFQLSTDGWHFLFSSNRAESFGKLDIFEGQFFEQQADQLVMTHTVETEENRTEQVAKTLLFQKYNSGSRFLDSTQFNELEKLVNTCLKLDSVFLVVNLHYLADESSQSIQKTPGMEPIILKMLFDGLQGLPIIYRRQLTLDKAASSLGTFVEYRVLFHQEKNEQPIQAINQTRRYHFIPRVAPGLRYRIEVAKNNALNKFLETNKYDFSFEKTQKLTGSRLFGDCLTFETAQQWEDELLRHGIQATKIIPYVQGIPLKADQVRNLVGEYPDLRYFLAR